MPQKHSSKAKVSFAFIALQKYLNRNKLIINGLLQQLVLIEVLLFYSCAAVRSSEIFMLSLKLRFLSIRAAGGRKTLLASIVFFLSLRKDDPRIRRGEIILIVKTKIFLPFSTA